MKPITLLIVDDYKLIIKILSGILNSDPRFKVIGTCGTGEEGVILAQELNPDIVLMDLELPGISGSEATEILISKRPDIKILGLSSHTHPFYTYQMMRKGAMGYITKLSSKSELFFALQEIMKGNKYTSFQTIVN
jgi:two-component system invasion response regulator UvrY